ncbi:prepilin-type N-terminal cleavage/methylation domain-containing protein [Sporosarcina sp. JAI121]|uniref:prepilin-type N-terminal cleavage/methylation domain-containing protein n=1 Tax=Sporosarcina sp. JAI121 TaxID=2723064 RepID=UPI0015CBFF18|nr:prepilin-type N-terminal cleavage/methylation domain-containing protein [Sporosarcina sp. JAI121]NYF24594.1 competence protein ComGD [Sporosarcina sp. JAI121]
MGEDTNESGFTFVEMILVLAVLAIMTAIIFPVSAKWIRTASEEEAVQALIASIYSLQAHSMANYIVTKLEFKHSGTEYTTSDLEGNIITKTVFPEGMRYVGSSQFNVIEFRADGDIVKTGTITLSTSTGLIEIRLQFQRGRMIIYE